MGQYLENVIWTPVSVHHELERRSMVQLGRAHCLKPQANGSESRVSVLLFTNTASPAVRLLFLVIRMYSRFGVYSNLVSPINGDTLLNLERYTRNP